MAALTPIRREVIVGADPALAFAVFTDDIGSWWPLAGHSVHGEGSTVAFRDGRLVESHPGQPDAEWGTVTTWAPPDELAFTWHPGRSDERVSRVQVRFQAVEPGRTLVRLKHSGWEIYADPEAARVDYDQGWPLVLDGYRAAVYTDHGTWVVLQHTPTEPGRDVFSDPRFRDHVAFLNRMRAAGLLVAAGPLGDEIGAGMTILRLPGPDRGDEAVRLATTEDAGVTGGLFAVRVRPWQVVQAG